MSERIRTGITGLDEMLGGGLFGGTVAVVKGAPGTGKTSIAIEFIGRGIEMGEAGAFITFEEFPSQIIRDANSLGFDFEEYQKKGKLKLICTSPSVLVSEIKSPGGLIDSMVVDMGISRIVIDSINYLTLFSEGPANLRESIYAFLNGLRRYGITTLVTLEDQEITGEIEGSGFGLSFIVDTLIQLRYIEFNSEVHKALVVLKQRATAHDTKIRSLVMSAKGVSVGQPFAEYEGLLSGHTRLRNKTADELRQKGVFK